MCVGGGWTRENSGLLIKSNVSVFLLNSKGRNSIPVFRREIEREMNALHRPTDIIDRTLKLWCDKREAFVTS